MCVYKKNTLQAVRRVNRRRQTKLTSSLIVLRRKEERFNQGSNTGNESKVDFRHISKVKSTGPSEYKMETKEILK